MGCSIYLDKGNVVQFGYTIISWESDVRENFDDLLFRIGSDEGQSTNGDFDVGFQFTVVFDI